MFLICLCIVQIGKVHQLSTSPMRHSENTCRNTYGCVAVNHSCGFIFIWRCSVCPVGRYCNTKTDRIGYVNTESQPRECGNTGNIPRIHVNHPSVGLRGPINTFVSKAVCTFTSIYILFYYYLYFTKLHKQVLMCVFYVN